jgi:3-methyladenine DNA glycosylase Tag
MESNFQIGKWTKKKPLPAQSTESEAVSKDLLKRGFRSVGPRSANSFMQAGEW